MANLAAPALVGIRALLIKLVVWSFNFCDWIQSIISSRYIYVFGLKRVQVVRLPNNTSFL